MTSTRLSPPPCYSTWLDYAVDCMDTRSLELELMFEDNSEKWRWPIGTTREQMDKAVREELAELRALAFDPVKQQNERQEWVGRKSELLAQHGKSIRSTGLAGDSILINPSDQEPTELLSFKNCAAIEKAGSGVCFHCLNGFRFERIVTWTDDGTTAICPICGVDSVLASNSDQPITLDLLIDFQHANFNARGLGRVGVKPCSWCQRDKAAKRCLRVFRDKDSACPARYRAIESIVAGNRARHSISKWRIAEA